MPRFFLIPIATLTFSNLALAACPTSVQTYMGSTSGSVLPNSLLNVHELFIFRAPPGSRWVEESPPTPRFSIPTPLKSALDLNRLSHDDWKKTKDYFLAGRANEKPYQSQTAEQQSSRLAAEAMTSKNFDDMIGCYLSQTRLSAGKPTTPAERVAKPQATKGPAKPPVTPAEQAELEMAEKAVKNDKEILEIQSNYYRKRVQGGKDPASLRAKIISNKCVQFANHGNGITADIKSVTNVCSTPVAVTYCFHRPGLNAGCSNGTVGWGTTNTIFPGDAKLVVSPGRGDRWKVNYYVCDASENKLCLQP